MITIISTERTFGPLFYFPQTVRISTDDGVMGWKPGEGSRKSMGYIC
jgi:hypothetical protein